MNSAFDKLATFQERNEYGSVRLYPVNHTALLLCRLLDRKTFDENKREVVEALGFTVEVH